MATNRTPSSNTYWSFMTALVDGDLVTMQRLYNEGLHRLQDNAHYVLGKVAQVYADLASTAAGGHAFSVGNVNITAFDFQSGAALNGLTIIVDEDTSAAQTCTFDNTITTPALLLAALTSQAGTNLTWSLTSDGFLRVQSNTVGAGSTLAAPAGTAATALFGSASTTSPGSSTVNDGASRIGLAAFPGWGGGTLQNFLSTLFAYIGTLDDSTLASDGGTLPQANYTILPADVDSRRTYFRIPALLANYEYTLPSAVDDGTSLVFRGNPNSPFTIVIRRPDTTSIATMSFAIGATQVQQCLEVTKFGGTWVVTAFGASEDNYTLG